MDLPGFGEAELGQDPEYLGVLNTMDALGLEQAVLVGNSFGGGWRCAWLRSRLSA